MEKATTMGWIKASRLKSSKTKVNPIYTKISSFLSTMNFKHGATFIITVNIITYSVVLIANNL